MRVCQTAILHLALLAAFGSLIVTAPLVLNLLAFVAWAFIVRAWALRWRRSQHAGRVNSGSAVQMAGMTAIVLAAGLAPVKTVDAQKARRIMLPKQVMTLAQLADPIEFGFDRIYNGSLTAPNGMANRTVQFPCRELSVGQFIAAIEHQTPLRHRFAHCGNGATILWGGDCSFGLHFRSP